MIEPSPHEILAELARRVDAEMMAEGVPSEIFGETVATMSFARLYEVRRDIGHSIDWTSAEAACLRRPELTLAEMIHDTAELTVIDAVVGALEPHIVQMAHVADAAVPEWNALSKPISARYGAHGRGAIRRAVQMVRQRNLQPLDLQEARSLEAPETPTDVQKLAELSADLGQAIEAELHAMDLTMGAFQAANGVVLDVITLDSGVNATDWINATFVEEQRAVWRSLLLPYQSLRSEVPRLLLAVAVSKASPAGIVDALQRFGTVLASRRLAYGTHEEALADVAIAARFGSIRMDAFAVDRVIESRAANLEHLTSGVTWLEDARLIHELGNVDIPLSELLENTLNRVGALATADHTFGRPLDVMLSERGTKSRLLIEEITGANTRAVSNVQFILEAKSSGAVNTPGLELP